MCLGPMARSIEVTLQEGEDASAVDARSVVTPAVVELRVTAHSPVVPTVVQLATLNEPGPLTFVKLTTVSTGAFTNPEPSFTLTCAVNVCGEPTSFVAASGSIWMFASTTCRGSHGPVADE